MCISPSKLYIKLCDKGRKCEKYVVSHSSYKGLIVFGPQNATKMETTSYFPPLFFIFDVTGRLRRCLNYKNLTPFPFLSP